MSWKGTGLGLALCVVGLIAFLILGIAVSGQKSAGGTLRSGRAVVAYSRGLSLSAEFQDDTATFRTKGKTIVVAPTAVSVDGAEVARIDAVASNVQVHVHAEGIDIAADGKPVDTKVTHAGTGSPAARR